MMTVAAEKLTGVSALLACALMAALAWPAGGVVALVAALTPLVVVVGFAADSARRIHPAAAAAAGLVADALSGGPLGQWAAIYALAAVLARRLPTRTLPSRVLSLASLSIVAGTCHGLVAAAQTATLRHVPHDAATVGYAVVALVSITLLFELVGRALGTTAARIAGTVSASTRKRRLAEGGGPPWR